MDAANDNVVLDAVLSILDEHDASDALHGSPSKTPTSSPSPTSSEAGDSGDHSAGSADTPVPEKTAQKPVRAAEPRIKRVAVRSDKRQREELVALREESLALQDELDQLQREMIDAHAESVAAPPVKKRALKQEIHSEESRKLRAEVWQAISEAHQKRREAAEQERDRLRALIREQKLAYRRMRRYFATLAMKANEGAAEVSELQEHSKTNEGDTSGKDGFEELSRSLPTMLLQTNGLFKDKRLDSLTSHLRDLRVQNEQTAKMSIEALESRLVPFDVTSTAQAVWTHHLTKAYRRTPSENEKLEVTENCVRRTFTALFKGLTEEVTTARGRTEFRRCVEANRVVIIKSSIMDRIAVDSMLVPQFAIREFQWTVIGPPRADVLRGTGNTMSQIEIFRVSIPQMPNTEGMDEEMLRRAMKNGCTQAVSLQLEFERQSIENILLQELTTTAGLHSDMIHQSSWG